MQTRKLYYEDCHLRQFTATVTGCNQTEKGYQVTLDATAFYPEGGGQACDLGKLGTARVLDVRESGEQIFHLCDSPLAVGSQVSGELDWQRRFDLMQQHSGEHILTGLIHKTFGYHNVGFHVGKEAMEVDFDGPITWEALLVLERLANEAVWQDIPIECWYPSQEELPQVSYRSKKALPWPVRIVRVPGYDSCACCGVHVGRTGQIGIIKVLSCVKFHQGVRIEMLCGQRAFDYLSQVYEQNRQVSQLLSATQRKTALAVRRQLDQLAGEKLRTEVLEKQLFYRIAEGYAGCGDVLHFQEGLTPGSIRELADAIAAVCGGRAAVFSGSDDRGYNVCMTNKDGDVCALGKALNERLNGRGGGKSSTFQGSVMATRAAIEAFFGVDANNFF